MTLILGLETSCDETAASVVRSGHLVLSNTIGTQHELHEEYRGVVPEIASRAHVEKIIPVIDQSLREAGVKLDELDAIAVGNRPGLIGSLLVGVSAAKGLSLALGKPLLGVDHVRAHLMAWRLHEPHEPETSIPAPTAENPHVGLVVSGGHTSLYRITADHSEGLEVLGRTIDDAVGEAFDKAASILHLPYPGGPNIDKAAQQGSVEAYDLPRSYLSKAELNFSFSGLKTALLYQVRGTPVGRGKASTFTKSGEDLTNQERCDFAASFQKAAMDPVIKKLQYAIERIPGCAAIILGGGVTANSMLRERTQNLADRFGLPIGLPKMAYCMDNAAMIAGLAHDRLVAEDVDDLTLQAMAASGM